MHDDMKMDIKNLFLLIIFFNNAMKMYM